MTRGHSVRGRDRGTPREPAARCPVCAGPIGRGRLGLPARDRGFCPRCRTPYSFAPPLRAGDVAGGYEIVECLAEGGPGPAGWVFSAVDLRGVAGAAETTGTGDPTGPGSPGSPGSGGGVPGRLVVLKSVRRGGMRPPARLGLRPGRRLPPDPPLRHPAIVETLGEVRHDGVVYAVMELVSGPSLADLLRSRRAARGGAPAPLPVPEAVAGVRRLLSALEYVHDRGYVFCDLAPGNVVWDGDRVTLIDLQAIREPGRRGGTFHVTAGFDAPELTASPPSVGSDLYALGRLLATAVLDFPNRASTYRYTLPAQEVDQVLARHEPLRRFLLRATAADPADRFARAADMARELAGIAVDGAAAPAVEATAEARNRAPTREKVGEVAEVTESARGEGVLETELRPIPGARASAGTEGGTEITGVDASGGSCHYSFRRTWI
ncbi:serine/threonine protein kinase [Parafrankia sp. BMG5.11]|uniref:protein kinase domain-containing protein n=1 Tax=Parafrankia sp. BMG5.11 TaxID=222540 RepID=UPI0010407BA0|nr:serine/threonine protein kinase [Parafrankia sp. BMG5.11]TCJ34484.1 serine/threonine protein kinase [Parafrankia sp. BMG5.11]